MKRGLLLFIVLLAFLATGCFTMQSGDQDSGEIKFLIGVSQANLGEPWRVQMNRDIQQEAAKEKDIRVIFTDAAQNNQKQIQDVQRLMKQGIDLLIISPNEAKPLTPIVQSVYQKIPVIVVDRDIESNDYTMFIGADNRLIGREAGQYVEHLLGAKGGNVFEITGLSGSTPAADRSAGFQEAIAANPHIHVVESISADWLRDKSEDMMKEELRKWPNVDVIFAQNDPMALGAYKAASELGRKGIQFVGIDGLPDKWGGLQLVRQNILQATFIYPTGGKEAVQYAIRILNHEANLPKRVTLNSIQVTADNVSDSIQTSNGLNAQRSD